jgi:hypothetical protein
MAPALTSCEQRRCSSCGLIHIRRPKTVVHPLELTWTSEVCLVTLGGKDSTAGAARHFKACQSPSGVEGGLGRTARTALARTLEQYLFPSGEEAT